jgi:hypothetical protein
MNAWYLRLFALGAPDFMAADRKRLGAGSDALLGTLSISGATTESP